MDDLLIYSKDKKEHMQHLTTILEALIRNGLKISPKKAMLFRKSLVYMGHRLSIEDDRPCISALRSKCDAIRRLEAPKTPKEVRSFIGAVNYLAMYLPELHLLLRPLYALTRKRGKFLWTEEHQVNFEKVKQLLIAPPILTMPKTEGKFTMYSDTSKIATGASLWQEQDGRERLIAYHSKSLAPAASRYTITELELTGLWINILAFKNLLKAVHFKAVVDHSALIHMINSKQEPATLRLRKLLERLGGFSFDLVYQKGSQMVICDLLSRMCSPPDEDTQVVIPVALPAVAKVERPMTRAYAKKLREQSVKTAESTCQNKVEPSLPPAGSNVPAVMDGSADKTAEAPPSGQVVNNEIAGRPTATPEPTHSTVHEESVTELPWQHQIPRGREQFPSKAKVIETVESELPEYMYKSPQPLFEQLSEEQILLKRVPRQIEINKMLKLIKTRCLRDYHLPLSVIEIKHEQQKCPYFKEIYSYLEHDILSSNKRKARSIRGKSENYVLVSGVLFKIDITPDEQDCKLALCIPEKMADRIISLYHDSLLASHQGVSRTFTTIRRQYYIPKLYEKIVAYLQTCITCQTRKIPQERDIATPYEPRIFAEYSVFSELHIDIKNLFNSAEGYNYLLVCVCAHTRYVVAVPLRRIDAISVAEALIQKVILVFGIPARLVMDEGRSFVNAVLTHIMKTLKIDPILISPANHQSLICERTIGSISRLLLNHLSGYGRQWARFVQAACYAYNTFSHTLLGGYSPHYLVFLKEPPDILKLDLTLGTEMPISYQEYVEQLRFRFQAIAKMMLEMRREQQRKSAEESKNKIRSYRVFTPGQLVYLLLPAATDLDTKTKGFKVSYVGPVKIDTILDSTHVTLSDIQGRMIYGVFHTKRLKPAFIRTDKGPVATVEELKKLVKSGKSPEEQKASVAIVDEREQEMPRIQAHHVIMAEILGENQANVAISQPHNNDRLDNSPDVYRIEEPEKWDELEESLAEYIRNKEANQNIAAETEISDQVKLRLIKHLEKMPAKGVILKPVKARFKDGDLQVLFRGQDESKYTQWIALTEHPKLAREFKFERDEELSPHDLSGRIWTIDGYLKVSGTVKR